MLTVWRAVLDANEKSAQARVAVSEKYKNEIYDSIKNFQMLKEANLKKVYLVELPIIISFIVLIIATNNILVSGSIKYFTK